MLAAVREAITVGQLGVRFVVEPGDSNGSAAVFECYVPASSRMPAPHSHDAFEETIYGLEGVSTWTVDGETIEIGPGEAVCVPRGAIHGFENRGSSDTRRVSLCASQTPG
jgi:quercetin dioxygenase-like cupin family protein